jgi:hypothetical protein
MCLVRSYRSNPGLETAFWKSKIFGKNIFDCGIKSEVVYAAKAKSVADIFPKTGCQPQCNEGADLSFLKCGQDLCDRSE